MEDLLSDESFQLWISGRATGVQTKKWSDWLKEDPSHHELYEGALKLWELVQFLPAALTEIDKEWEKLSRNLDLKSEKSAAIHSLPGRRDSSRWTRRVRPSWLRYGGMAAAALLVIALLLQNTFFQKTAEKQKFQIVSTEYGQRAQITLPEGTMIILNANSTLKYPAVWTKTTARRFEVRGEAHFDVTALPEGAQHDFIIQTTDGVVKVIGTRFVIYERGKGTRVVVEEGGVEVMVADTSALSPASAAKILLKPGHLLQFQKGMRNLTPKDVNILAYTTWWREHLVFEETPFEEIVQRLEETYGIEIEVKDQRLLHRTLSGSIENRNLGVIVEALAKALKIPVQQKGQVVIFGES